MPSDTFRGDRRWPACATALVAVAFAVTAAAFVAQPLLASFADDSASYLVMAQVLTPWAAVPAPVAEAFSHEAFYPPLFPLVLALSGAAFDVARAHVVCALSLAAALVAQYALAARWLASRWAAVAAVAATALLPSLWINVKGILSEPLFALLLPCVLLSLERPRTARALAATAALMAALVLTRTPGLVMLGAYAAWALWRHRSRWRDAGLALAPVVVALLAYGAWLWLRPADTSDEYARYAGAATHWIADSGDAIGAFAGRLGTNVAALADAWLGALLLFWMPAQPLRWLLAAAIFAVAATGWVLRVRRGHADGWMLLAYAAILLLWPFPGQMTRFLFPVLPVLVLYAFVGLDAIAAARPAAARLAPAGLALLVASLAAPSLAFIHERARLGAASGEAAMTEWYRTPDLAQAHARAAVHLGLLDDMRAIRERTRPEERVMWVAPAYVALLADRRAMAAPPDEAGADAYRDAVRRRHPDAVFLSRYHPRDTVSDQAWRIGSAALQGEWQVVYERASPDGAPQSRLLRPAVAAAR